MELSDLNARFAIQDVLVFKQGPGGLVVAEVENEAASALIALQGAQLMGWTPGAEQPVIWLSEAAGFEAGKSIRGGVPLCWPWFGPHASEAGYPAHGYARTVLWEVLTTEALSPVQTRLVLRLVETDATRAWWPHDTPVECHITVGEVLEFELVTRNAGSEPVTIGEALHTYFEVGDVARVQVLGLEDASSQARFAWADQLSRNVDQVPHVLHVLSSWWHDVLVLASGSGVQVANLDRRSLLLEWAARYGVDTAQRVLGEIRDTRWRLEHNANRRLALEVLMLDLPKR